MLFISTSISAAALLAGGTAWIWLDPGRAGARHTSRGDGYLSAHKPAEAIIEYRAALQNRPNSSSTFRKLGVAYRSNGESWRAGDAFRYAADLAAEDLQSQLVAGWYSLVQHRPEDARRYAQRVLVADPNNPSAARLLANAMACFGEFTEGLDVLQAAAKRDPLNAATFSNIALLEAARGDKDAAALASERARTLTPQGQGIWFGATGGPLVATGAPPSPAQQEPVLSDPLPEPSSSETPPTVIEGGVGGVAAGSEAGAAPIVITGVVKTGPDGGASVQFTAVNAGTGRPLDGRLSPSASGGSSVSISSVPEPASLVLLLSGGLVGGSSRWLRRRRARRSV